MLWTLSIVFVLTVILGVPIAFCLGLSALAYFIQMGDPKMLMVVPHRMFSAVDSFPMLAIPFFMLAGELMLISGILDRLLRFSDMIVGRIRGGMAQVNIVVSMLFAGVSGAAVADTAAIGSVMIPAMKDKGYDAEFSCAVTGASSTIGPIIPPSISMILYALIYEKVSITGLFITGVIPGIFMGLCLMVLVWYFSKKRNYPRIIEEWTIRKILTTIRRSLLPLLMPVIIIGGIVFGVFTVTEASVTAVIYALLLGFFVTKKLKLNQLPGAIIRSATTTSVVLMLFAAGNVVSWLVIRHHIPMQLGQWFLSISDYWMVYLALVIIFMLLLGAVIDPAASLIMFVPIFAPIAETYNINPYHFGVIFVLVLQIGLLTPPVGLVLFLCAQIGNIGLEKVVRGIWPFIVVLVIVLLVLTFIPQTFMWFPKMMGYG